MDNGSTQTKGVSWENSTEFTPVESTSVQQNSTQGLREDFDNRLGGTGKNYLPNEIGNALRQHFMLAAFILILVGYVMIETFSSRKIDFQQYLTLVLLLFLLVAVGRVFTTEKIFEKFNFWIVQGLKNKHPLSTITIIFFFDSILNHWPLIIRGFLYLKSVAAMIIKN